ncbi:MAG TPA: MoxR family ATPase [Candidatus Thermoplasmatota archaeon]|jgi:MoxR-like ATPase|nr:MoxR family ATPase [Candidatus Thermoplasmatota archaeon]
MAVDAEIKRLKVAAATPQARKPDAGVSRDLGGAVKQVQRISESIIGEVAKVIVGKREVLELVQVNVLSAGNVLFEDFPGLAKSVMANTMSRASGCDFKRVQFTPDLLPADITGIYIYNQRTGEFEFRPGPVFTNFLLADEINRAPPKTQAAMLETMAERQVTVEGTTHQLEKPYIVMATQNPIEQEGTYPLPEAQMDRFLMKISMGYPSEEEEAEILRRRMVRKKDEFDVKAVTNPEQIVSMQKVVENIHVDDALLNYIAKLITMTRKEPRILVGASPRGSLALFKLARSYAAVKGRDFITPDDVKRVAVPGLSHRMILRPEARIKGITTTQIVQDILQTAPVPTV